MLDPMEVTMDAAAIRQAFTAVPVQAVRTDSSVAPGAVATELPAPKTVASAWEASPTRMDLTPQAGALARLAQAMQRVPEQRFERDRKTDVLVFKQVDPGTGEVLLQLPDQSLLNLRAYLREQEEAALPSLEKTA
jgi:hypothetical protein